MIPCSHPGPPHPPPQHGRAHLLYRGLTLPLLLLCGLSGITLGARDSQRSGQRDGGERSGGNKRLYPEIPVTVAFTSDIEFGKGGGKPLLLDIAMPKQIPSGLMPAVIYVHGGGWFTGSKDEPNHKDKIILLAENGFVAVSINYRLVGEAIFPAAIEDCKCAVRFLRGNAQKYHLNPERIGAWGESAGGHLVQLMGTSDEGAGLDGKGGWEAISSRVQAVSTWYGMSDLIHGQSKIMEKGCMDFLGGTASEKAALYKLASPISHVTRDDPPFLLVHGDQDPRCPLAQSQNLEKALGSVGIRAKLIVVPGGGHGFYQMPDKLRELYQETVAFFQETLK